MVPSAGVVSALMTWTKQATPGDAVVDRAAEVSAPPVIGEVFAVFSTNQNCDVSVSGIVEIKKRARQQMLSAFDLHRWKIKDFLTQDLSRYDSICF